ncbi:hypothetical protein N9O57_00630 [bacterium]|nr:hypothetical protein [bacterium]
MSVETIDQYLFDNEFSNDFKDWLNLDLKSMTWEGRFENEFNSFWDHLFKSSLSLVQIKERFNFLKKISKNGPIQSWVIWLEEKFLIFILQKSNLSIRELCDSYEIEITHFSKSLRDFLLENYPALHILIDKSLLISFRGQKKANLSFEKLCTSMGIEKNSLFCRSNSLFKSLEVTLFNDWADILKKMKARFELDYDKVLKLKRTQTKKSFNRFVLEFVSILLIGAFLIYVVTLVNKVYERYLLSQIDIYSPKIEWLSKDLKYKEKKSSKDQIAIAQQDIENLDKEVFKDLEFLNEAPRFEAESEVVLTSWDNLPQDIDKANEDVSEYEEERPGGFRDSRYGRRTVYRVIMKSAKPGSVKEQIKSLLDKYDVTKGDRVSPGMAVPGGVYYNLFVPTDYLKEFLAQVTKLESSRIFESKTQRANPRGKNKVFIWIKEV